MRALSIMSVIAFSDRSDRPAARSARDIARCATDGQVRLWWDTTPVDVFTNTTEFHRGAAIFRDATASSRV